MNRLPWIAVSVVALALLAFLFWYTPERRAAMAVNAPAAQALPTNAPTLPGVPSARVAQTPGGPATAIPGSPAALIDAGAPDPAGPFDVNLGKQTIYLKDDAQGRVAHFELHLTVTNQAAERETRLRREELLRMTYFLGSHRVADGALGEDGRDRFAHDLLERYRNVVRSGEVMDVKLEGYEVVPGPPRAAPLR